MIIIIWRDTERLYLFHFSGYNMGVRLIDDFLARNPTVTRCQDFRDTADVLARVRKFRKASLKHFSEEKTRKHFSNFVLFFNL